LLIDWDDDKASTSTLTDDVLSDSAKRLFELRDRLKELGREEKALCATLASMCPEEPGEHFLDAGDFTVTVRGARKMQWDQEKLNTALDLYYKLSGSTRPKWLEPKLSISQPQLETMSASDPGLYSAIVPALTIMPGSTTVKVSEVSAMKLKAPPSTTGCYEATATYDPAADVTTMVYTASGPCIVADRSLMAGDTMTLVIDGCHTTF